jgi:hypothetical protein
MKSLASDRRYFAFHKCALGRKMTEMHKRLKKKMLHVGQRLSLGMHRQRCAAGLDSDTSLTLNSLTRSLSMFANCWT